MDRPESEQFQIVTDPVRQGKYAAKTIVHDGDEFLDTGGERCDLEHAGPFEKEGDEYWYAFSTLFPDDWQAPGDWFVFIDWHSDYPDVCQLLQFEVEQDNSIIAKILTGDVTDYECFDGPGTAYLEEYTLLDAITPGKWNDFIIHVKWTARDKGVIEIWHKLEGEQSFVKKVNLHDIPTLQYQGSRWKAPSPYLKLAHYRSEVDTHTSVIYHDGFRQATGREYLAEDGLYDLND